MVRGRDELGDARPELERELTYECCFPRVCTTTQSPEIRMPGQACQGYDASSDVSAGTMSLALTSVPP